MSVNSWMADLRIMQAEADAFVAQQLARNGRADDARAKHLAAAEAFASVALEVPSTHPNTRSDLALAALASFDGALAFERRGAFAGAMLAASGEGALRPDAVGELERAAGATART